MLFHFPFYCISEMEIDQNQYENTLYLILWRAFWDPQCNSRTFTKWKCETVLQAGESVRFVLFRYNRKTHTHVNLVTRIVLQIIKSSIHMIAQARRCGTVYPKFGSRISRTVHPWPVSHVPHTIPCPTYMPYPKSVAGTGFGWLRLKVGNDSSKAQSEGRKKSTISFSLSLYAGFAGLKT